MKKFKDLVEESPAKDYVGDGESQKDYDAAGSDEQKFKDLHLTHNSHLVQPKGHPVAPDYVFTGERPGGKKVMKARITRVVSRYQARRFSKHIKTLLRAESLQPAIKLL